MMSPRKENSLARKLAKELRERASEDMRRESCAKAARKQFYRLTSWSSVFEHCSCDILNEEWMDAGCVHTQPTLVIRQLGHVGLMSTHICLLPAIPSETMSFSLEALSPSKGCMLTPCPDCYLLILLRLLSVGRCILCILGEARRWVPLNGAVSEQQLIWLEDTRKVGLGQV